MFESLTNKLQDIFDRLGRRGVLSEADVDVALREVRLALLEADVALPVAKDFIKRVRERAIGTEVLKALKPAQMVIKIVFEELQATLGEPGRLNLSGTPPIVIMLVGLQGSGKTTTAAKLALKLRREGRRPYLVAADTYRPAAVDQLKTLGKQLDVPVYDEGTSAPPPDIAERGLRKAREVGAGVLIVDTAGRLQIDERLMSELEQIKARLKPAEILLVADAMTGQEAVKIAEGFHARLGITGLILTKMDGDARGGAAISMRAVTGVPIKFVGMGEKPDALDQFYPDRMAQRILGMGDVLSLIEKVQQDVDEAEALRLQQRMLENRFTLEDYRAQLRQVGKLGSLDKLLGMLPDGLLGGMNLRLSPQQTQLMQRKLKETEAIINSMTKQERNDHTLLAKTPSRRKRVAKGSGTTVRKVEELLNEFSMMRQMMQQMTRGGLFGGLGGLFGGLGGGLGGMLPSGLRGGPGGFGGGKRSKQHTPPKKKKKRK